MINWIKKPDYKTLTWIIIALAILLRAIWALAIPVIPVSDSAAYDTFAWNIVELGTYGWAANQPSSYWPVGTSALYAFFYYLFGHVYWPIVIFNIAASVITIAVTMQLSRQLFGVGPALLTGFLLTIWPSQILYVTVLASELPFTLLTISALFLWLKNGNKKLVDAMLVGIILALASYIRPLALLLPFVFVAIKLIQRKQWLTQIKMLTITFIIMGAIISPWTLRNYNLWGEVVLISTNGPAVFWMGNNPDTDGTYTKLPEWTKSLSEYERSIKLGESAREYIATKPLVFIKNFFIKIVKTHMGETIAVHWNAKGIEKVLGENALSPLKLVTQVYWALVLITALWGAFILFSKLGFIQWLLHPTIIIWSYYAFIHGITLAQDRYHFPSVPYIAALSAYAFTHYLKKRHEKNKNEK